MVWHACMYFWKVSQSRLCGTISTLTLWAVWPAWKLQSLNNGFSTCNRRINLSFVPYKKEPPSCWHPAYQRGEAGSKRGLCLASIFHLQWRLSLINSASVSLENENFIQHNAPCELINEAFTGGSKLKCILPACFVSFLLSFFCCCAIQYMFPSCWWNLPSCYLHGDIKIKLQSTIK